MADKRTQFTWDPIALAAQLRNIARQSQVLMRHFVSHQPDAIKQVNARVRVFRAHDEDDDRPGGSRQRSD